MSQFLLGCSSILVSVLGTSMRPRDACEFQRGSRRPPAASTCSGRRMPFKEGHNIKDEKCCQLTEIQAAAAVRRLDVIIGRNKIRALSAVATATGRRRYTCYGPNQFMDAATNSPQCRTNTWESIACNCAAGTAFEGTVRCSRSMTVQTNNTCSHATRT
ncbi:uncharacterized protein M437DRAFT_64507 [Aureobasidium melanogenum CBS 110374]|uniref:Cyanovirin-N domain-containing protein n=1 Tax=Aureobasidium melanogenum (strain CBS 110374) TaxID=1043003 RepID=A0A074VVR0_AURM1|nr:uncharacterized protein M437DRAFT_64507 [Aureobasidium melanogenum CBS 110374]KEQ64890.1 hypothetical protein M437DRAFT_64507 [Aureobasidium melanogenum CBS 110374]